MLTSQVFQSDVTTARVGDWLLVSPAGGAAPSLVGDTVEPVWAFGLRDWSRGGRAGCLEGVFSTVRLAAQPINATAGDVFDVELWALPDAPNGGGVLLAALVWTPAAERLSSPSILAVVAGCPASSWAVSARCRTPASRRNVAWSCWLGPTVGASGVLWRGEGVV